MVYQEDHLMGIVHKHHLLAHECQHSASTIPMQGTWSDALLRMKHSRTINPSQRYSNAVSHQVGPEPGHDHVRITVPATHTSSSIVSHLGSRFSPRRLCVLHLRQTILDVSLIHHHACHSA